MSLEDFWSRLSNMLSGGGSSNFGSGGATGGATGGYNNGLIPALYKFANVAPGTGMGAGINTDLATGKTSDVPGSGVPTPGDVRKMAGMYGGGPMNSLAKGLNSMSDSFKPSAVPNGGTMAQAPIPVPGPAAYARTGPSPNMMSSISQSMMPGSPTASGPPPTGPAAMNPLLALLRARLMGGAMQ